MARHAAIRRLTKEDEEQGRETRGYKCGEIEEIAVMRGAAGYNSDGEERKWADEIVRRRNNGYAEMDTD